MKLDPPTKLLLLDAGGVLVTEPIPQLLRLLSATGNRDLADLSRYYRDEVSGRLWASDLSEQEFWRRMVARSESVVTPELARDFFLAALKPLPAWHRVGQWGRQAHVGVLSNHLKEWLRPLLPPNLDHRLVWISSITKAVKPAPAAYDEAADLAKAGWDVLFVDDRLDNVVAAQASGIRSFVAEPGWEAIVDAWASAPAGGITERRWRSGLPGWVDDHPQ